jgi:glycosyltransferase involved in cell wall biosynthesis
MPNPIRIAVMLRAFDEKGGIGVYTRNLVETMLDLDRSNQYILLYREPSNVGRFADRPNVVERVVRGWNKAVWDQIGVPRAAAAEQADVILHPKFTVPLLTSRKSVMVLHGADWFLPDAAHFYGRLDRLYMHVFMPLYLRRAAKVLSVSQITTDHFDRIFRMPPGKVQTVYFGPARHFRHVEDRQVLDEVRRRYDLPERFILTLSKVAGGERKNIGGVFRAYERLHGTIPHELVVVGKGCEQFRKDYAVPDTDWGASVRFPGWIDQADLPAVYSLSDVFLYPSNMEAFPIPITEAMATGTPIVTSRANGLEEIAGEAALLVDHTDPDQIAEAVRRIVEEDPLRDRLVRAGLERAATFSWEKCARETLAVLRELVHPGAQPGSLESGDSVPADDLRFGAVNGSPTGGEAS